MNSRIGSVSLVLLLGVVCGVFNVGASAQVTTETNTRAGTPSHEVTVERGEVVLVEGNDLVVKAEDGTFRHFANVPESAKAMVDGKEMGIHDLKPGMKLQRTITVTTIPKTITTVQTVTGKVWHVTPPGSVILTLADGTNQQFNIPKGQMFTVDGQQTDAWGLRKGMKVSATKIVEAPEVEVQHQHQVTGTMPPPPPAPTADAPILIAVAQPAPAPTSSEPAELPKTGSLLPLIGLLGSLSLLSSLGVGAIRKLF